MRGIVLSGALIVAGLTLTSELADAQARGSYARSCRGIDQRGPMLIADCRDTRGRWRETRLDTRGCVGDIRNNNGRLECARRDFRDDRRDFRDDRRSPGGYMR